MAGGNRVYLRTCQWQGRVSLGCPPQRFRSGHPGSVYHRDMIGSMMEGACRRNSCIHGTHLSHDHSLRSRSPNVPDCHSPMGAVKHISSVIGPCLVVYCSMMEGQNLGAEGRRYLPCHLDARVFPMCDDLSVFIFSIVSRKTMSYLPRHRTRTF